MSAIMIAGIAAKIEPTTGIKFRKKQVLPKEKHKKYHKTTK
jgi:hypothetical protein